jgi:acetyl/propionyl-CoA carboxylase alpha subunit
LDDGYDEGMDIPIYYDPMIAKLVTYGENREAAISNMLKAIEDYDIEGVSTTLSFGKFVCQHEAFTSGNFDTHFVKKYYTPEELQKESQAEAEIAAQLALKIYLEHKGILKVPQVEESDWAGR